MPEDTEILPPPEELPNRCAVDLDSQGNHTPLPPEATRIVREDEETSRTGIIRCERQVFELARERFGLGEKGATA